MKSCSEFCAGRRRLVQSVAGERSLLVLSAAPQTRAPFERPLRIGLMLQHMVRLQREARVQRAHGRWAEPPKDSISLNLLGADLVTVTVTARGSGRGGL